MARPIKDGLDYFPLDVHFFEDDRIEALSGEFGLKGELAVIKLLCAIYEKGYFVVWNDLVKMKLVKRLPGVSTDLLDKIVDRLIKWEFFDKALFDSAGVLTSQEIQETYQEATKRRKKPKPSLYWINVNNNSGLTDVNVDINTQSKGNKSKVNKNKTNNSSERVSVTPDDKIRQTFTTDIWPLFGKQTKFEGAYQAYYEDLLEGATNEQIIAALKNLAVYYRINGTQQRYMINPKTYFEERRYTDTLDLTPPVPESANGQPIRKETLPAWAEDGYKAPKQQVTAEQRAALNARLAKLQEGAKS